MRGKIRKSSIRSTTVGGCETFIFLALVCIYSQRNVERIKHGRIVITAEHRPCVPTEIIGPANSENDERRGALNWRCLNGTTGRRAWRPQKATPTSRRGVTRTAVSFQLFEVALRPRQYFTSFVCLALSARLFAPGAPRRVSAYLNNASFVIRVIVRFDLARARGNSYIDARLRDYAITSIALPMRPAELTTRVSDRTTLRVHAGCTGIFEFILERDK